jgi:hypothetical protein
MALVLFRHCRQRGVTQMNYVALALPGCRDDPLSHDLVDDIRLAGVMQCLTGGVESVAHDFCCRVIKDAMWKKWNYGRHALTPDATSTRPRNCKLELSAAQAKIRFGWHNESRSFGATAKCVRSATLQEIC